MSKKFYFDEVTTFDDQNIFEPRRDVLRSEKIEKK